VKRSINRPPNRHDIWWSEHQLTCGGSFEKIAQPQVIRRSKQPRSFQQPKSKQVQRDKGQMNMNHLIYIDDKSSYSVFIQCPICGSKQPNELALNYHLDDCLSYQHIQQEKWLVALNKA
jgi:hypothetical protein